MKAEINEDMVVQEIPVYLSKTLAGQLHVFQYPVRPHFRTYDEENIVKANVKPESMQVQLEVGLHTKAPTYDRGKGDQIAINVDGAFRDQNDTNNYFQSNTMDKLVMTSTKALSNADRYAVGVIGEGSLHLTPITSVLTFRPSFTYLDMADKRSKFDQKEHSDDSDSEEKVKKVTVRFERPETDRSKAMKEKSYSYLQKKIQDEPWIPVQYHGYGSAKSDFESRHLYCAYQNEEVSQFGLDSVTYLQQLIPQNPDVLANVSKELSLHERVKSVMINAKVTSYTELVNAVNYGKKEEDTNSILKMVQEIAVLVQGNWVIKSEFLYPRDETSESLISYGIIQRARDCTLYLFTKGICIHRSNVTDLIEVPAEDLTDILKGIAKRKGAKGYWEFLLPQDSGFLKRHSEVSQRQQMIWQLCYERLSRSFIKHS